MSLKKKMKSLKKMSLVKKSLRRIGMMISSTTQMRTKIPSRFVNLVYLWIGVRSDPC